MTELLNKIKSGSKSALIQEDQKEYFCKDFDLSCFEITHPADCKKGKSVWIDSILYYTLPVLAVCPICDELSEKK